MIPVRETGDDVLVEVGEHALEGFRVARAASSRARGARRPAAMSGQDGPSPRRASGSRRSTPPRARAPRAACPRSSPRAGSPSGRSIWSGMQTPDSLESLRLLLADLRVAIEEEIEAVAADLSRRRLDRPIPALSGRLRGEAGTGHRYTFQIAGGTYDIRADDRVRIHAGGREALGTVHRFDRTLGLLQAMSPEWLGERLDGAELEFDPTWLLRELSAAAGRGGPGSGGVLPGHRARGLRPAASAPRPGVSAARVVRVT